MTTPLEYTERMVMRQTMAQLRELGLQLSYRFYVGNVSSWSSSQLSTIEQQLFSMEQRGFKDDIVVMDHVQEGYRNLVQKTRTAFLLATTTNTATGRFDYLVKVDSDLCLKPASFALTLLRYLWPPPASLVWAGRMSAVKREHNPTHRWFVPYEAWPPHEPSRHMSFINGGLYVLSFELARWLGQQHNDSRILRIAVEDLSVALSLEWASDQQVNRTTRRVDIPLMFNTDNLGLIHSKHAITNSYLLPPLSSMCDITHSSKVSPFVAIHYKNRQNPNALYCLQSRLSCVREQYGVVSLLRTIFDEYL